MHRASASLDGPASIGAPAIHGAPLRNRVDLIGIGVQKAATSWIFRCLEQHPQIRTAQVERGSDKELNFFNHAYEFGYTWYHRGFSFGPWRTLEFSTLYFHDHDVPARIHRYNPDVRLILSLRNPIDRAYSQHRFEVSRRRVPAGLYEFWAAAEQNPSYIEMGLYATHLTRWLEYFPLEQICIVDYDEIRAEPAGVLRRLFEFAGVDASVEPALVHGRVNVTAVPRNRLLTAFTSGSARVVRTVLGDAAVKTLRAARPVDYLRRRNRVELDARVVPPLTPQDRARLRAVFSPDIERLEALLSRDLSHWV
ncbi:MAG: sulfotransferase domain-containing protein [Gemmatimonadetes bacterium]|nr:sulfotransferase domain-containing protein [Gemmatimonadota bacterium]